MKILCGNSSNPSARILRDALQELMHNKILVTHKPETIRRGEYYIRYGNAMPVINGIDMNLNSIELICSAGNKGRFSRLTQEKIYTPIYHTNKPDHFPVMIRKTLTGFAGRGIEVVHSEAEFNSVWKNNDVWTDFIHTEFEVRAHVLGGKIIKLFKKIARGAESEFPIRHNENYDFSMMDISKWPKLIKSVENLCTIPVFSNGYYGLDAGWDSNKKEYFIYEINSAPGLNERSAFEYACFIYEEMSK